MTPFAGPGAEHKWTMRIALTIFALSLLLLGCHKQNITAGNSLTGTWLFETNFPDGTKFESSTTVNSNGIYLCHAISWGLSNHIRQFEIEGTWQIQDGFLIDTMTKNSGSTNIDLHWVSRYEIIQFNEQKLIAKYMTSNANNAIPTVFRKARN
jgi:hypothetical protein